MWPYRGHKVVTYRGSWWNLLKRFDLISIGEIEPIPGIPPSRDHTTELINRMKSENVGVIVVEPFFELKTPNSIARKTGAHVVVMPSSVGAEKGITDYFKLFDYDLGRIPWALAQGPITSGASNQALLPPIGQCRRPESRVVTESPKLHESPPHV
jgi:ABC-type Zn uptake system ZnuABC Zn-binding protein ZnuA